MTNVEVERQLELAADYSPRFQAQSRPTNGAAVILTIVRLGAHALERIDRRCAEQPDPDAYWLACEGALTGRRFDPALGLAAAGDLSELLGAIVAALHALSAQFKGAVDALVLRRMRLSYLISPTSLEVACMYGARR